MLPIPQRIALGLSLVLLAAAAPAVAQVKVGGPTVTPPHQAAVPSGTPLVTTEQSIEAQYAKLIQDAKSKQAALEDRIEALDEQIEALKQQASRIQLIAQKINQVLPKILSALGRGRRDPGAVIGAELAKVGVTASADELRWLAAAIDKGGPGASSRVDAEVSARIKRLAAAIDANRQAIKQLRAQIALLDQEIANLEKQRDKALADLKKQHQRAREEAQESDR